MRRCHHGDHADSPNWNHPNRMKHANPATPSQAVIEQALTNVCKLTLGIRLSRLVFKMVNYVVGERGGNQLLSRCR